MCNVMGKPNLTRSDPGLRRFCGVCLQHLPLKLDITASRAKNWDCKKGILPSTFPHKSALLRNYRFIADSRWCHKYTFLLTLWSSESEGNQKINIWDGNTLAACGCNCLFGTFPRRLLERLPYLTVMSGGARVPRLMLQGNRFSISICKNVDFTGKRCNISETYYEGE